MRTRRPTSKVSCSDRRRWVPALRHWNACWLTAATGCSSCTATVRCCPTPTAIRRPGSTPPPSCTTATCGCCSRRRAPPATSTPRPPRCWPCSTRTTYTISSRSAVRHSRRWAPRGSRWRANCAVDEQTASMTRWVLHVDLDQFQAAVEVRRRPELAGLPVIVGGSGDPTEPRKVVTCASYPAREHGVHAGMPLRSAARKCPDATFLPLDTDAYDQASAEVMGLLRDFGHPLEVWGWDEAYIGADVDDPVALADQLREVVAGETGLSCS